MFKDPIILALTEKYKAPKFTNRTKFLFEDLVESIINQQLSGKAATTIFKRFKALFSRKTGSRFAGNDKDIFPTAEQILRKKNTSIRKAGISFSKIKYIKGVAKAFKNGELEVDKFIKMSDEEIISELTRLKGVGRWTAEMILIFTLKRPDVFSVGDGGLRRAIKNLYNLERDREILALSEKWKPNRSWACWYLWKSLENK